MSTRNWSFFRAGGFDQAKLTTGADLLALDQLDQKLWVALACPVKGLEFDSRTLELMDTDKDGRIRPPELLAATRWAGSMLKNVDDLATGSAELKLSAIRDDTPEGRLLLSAARKVLDGLGRSNAPSLTVAEASESVKAFDQLPFNGDGVVTPESITDAALKAAAADVVACTGGTADRSGKQGFNAAQLEAFFGDVAAHVGWLKKAEETPDAFPLKDGTAAAYAAFTAVRAKVDDYFARCRLTAFDPRSATAVQRDEKEFAALASQQMSLSGAEFKEFPLAHAAAGRALPLKAGLNPAWADAVAELARTALVPLLGERTELTEADWLSVRTRLDAFGAWQAGKAGQSVEKLGVARLRELAASGHRKGLEELLGREKEQEPVAAALGGVERLARYQRDLMKLCNNFVSFKDFYTRAAPAVFQVGTLILDQRSCELCIRVEDAGRHASMAPLSGCYLAYCDCVRAATGEKMTIAAAFTNGDADNLMVGRNGVFYDRKGNDWDATITRIVENPISIRQAFMAPYKKLVRFIEEQANKRAAAADSAANEKLTGGVAELAAAEPGKAPAAPEKKFDVGTIAALGVAVGGITGAVGGLLGSLLGLGIWLPVGVLGIILGISLPSMAIAWLKLRKRNLAPLLDANGWAVNAPGRLNIPFGRSLTKVAVLPAGSTRELSDPFQEKPRPWGFWLVVVGALLLAGNWYLGKLDGLLPGPVKSVSVLGSYAPAAPAVAPAPAPAPAPAAAP